MEKLRARDYPARWITAGQARELEPDLICPPGADYAFFPEEAHVLPALLLSHLLGEAKDGGARIRYGASVTEITADAVHTEDGQRHPADIVVSCAGRWTSQVAQLAGAYVPMLDTATRGSTTVGLLTTTAAQPARLSRVLTTPALNVRPDGGGRLLLQALDLDQHADPSQPPDPGDPLPSDIVRRLPEVLSGTEGTVAERVRVGQRAMPADGRTVAGFTDPRFYVLATHSGITLAPLLAELATQELYGTDAAMLHDFRPDRFAPGTDVDAPQPARLPGEQ
jgi:glycine/D-amino acid oxidase-like deaminating enzyme